MVMPVIEPMIEPRIIDVMPPRRWWWRPQEEELKQPSQTFQIPPDGLVEIPVTIPSDVTRVEMNVRSPVQYTYMYAMCCILF